MMKKIVSLVVAFCMVMTLAGCTKKEYKQAVNLYKNGKYEEAYNAFTSLVLYKDSQEQAAICMDKILLGDWESEKLNMVDVFAQSVDTEMKSKVVTNISAKDYVTAFNMIGCITFKEDNIIEIRFDFDYDNIDQFRLDMEEYLRALLEEERKMPLTDEEIKNILGMTPEEYVADVWSYEALSEYFSGSNMTGTYKNNCGYIIISLENGTHVKGVVEDNKLTLEYKQYGNVEYTKTINKTSSSSYTKSSSSSTGSSGSYKSSGSSSTYSSSSGNSGSYKSSGSSSTYSNSSGSSSSYKSSTSSFTNAYGTSTTICAHPGCNNYIASSGDTNCCTVHSNKCRTCGKYIDEDALFCVDCLIKGVGSGLSSE